MDNKEMIFFYESSSRNTYGQRKIEVKRGIYIRDQQPVIQKLRTCNTKELAEQWCLKQGWGKSGYIKDLTTGEIKQLN